MRSQTCKALGTCAAVLLMGFLVTPSFGQLLDVDDIQLIESQGPSNVTLQALIPAPGGHLGLDTAVLGEDTFGLDPVHLLIRVVGVPPVPVQIGIDKDIINNSGVPWHDFHIEIDENPNPQIPLGPAGPPTFTGASDSTLPAPVFDTVTVDPQTVWFDDGLLPPGDTAVLWLGINIPGANAIDPISGAPSYEFLMWQHPSVVPEPSAIALGILGLSSLGMIGWRRRKQVSDKP